MEDKKIYKIISFLKENLKRKLMLGFSKINL